MRRGYGDNRRWYQWLDTDGWRGTVLVMVLIMVVGMAAHTIYALGGA